VYSIATKAQPQGWQPNWSSALILYRVDNLLKTFTSVLVHIVLDFMGGKSGY